MSTPLAPSLIAELAPYIAVAATGDCATVQTHQDAIRAGHACPTCLKSLAFYEAELGKLRV